MRDKCHGMSPSRQSDKRDILSRYFRHDIVTYVTPPIYRGVTCHGVMKEVYLNMIEKDFFSWRKAMTQDDFMRLVDSRYRSCCQVMTRKGMEYSRNDDKLHNFKRAAKMLGVTPEMALVGMMAKHLVSILDMVDDLQYRDSRPAPEVLAEKMNDTHNYFYLLEALLSEKSKSRGA